MKFRDIKVLYKYYCIIFILLIPSTAAIYVRDELACQPISTLDQSVYYTKYCTNTVESTFTKYYKSNNVKHAAAFKDCLRYPTNQAVLRISFNQSTPAAADGVIKNVHVFDFSPYELITLIDFQLLNHRDLSAADSSQPFVVNLIARQYTTFRIVNIPSNVRITLLLSGLCAIEVVSSNKQNLEIQSVPYFELPSSSAPTESPSLNSYLNNHGTSLNLSSTIKLNLYILCNINSLTVYLPSSKEREQRATVQLNDKIEGNLVQECRLAADNDKQQTAPPHQSTYFLVFQNFTSCTSAKLDSNEIRITIKQCSYKKNYKLILYSNETEGIRFLLDNPNCELTVESTNAVYNKFNDLISYGKIESARGRDDLLVHYLKHLDPVIKYIQVENTNEFYIQFDDSPEDSQADPQMKSNNRLRNNFEKMFFLDGQDKLKLAMNKSIIQTFFKENNLDLTEFVNKNEKISITNDIFKANFFEYYDSEEKKRDALLVFNSENYEYLNRSSFYLEKYEFYLTVKLNVERNLYLNKTKELYLNIQPIENELFQKSHFYYDNISNWLEYKIHSISDDKSILENNNVMSYRMKINVQMNTIDKKFPWNVNSCWVSNTTRDQSDEYIVVDERHYKYEVNANIEVAKANLITSWMVFNSDKIKHERYLNYSFEFLIKDIKSLLNNNYYYLYCKYKPTIEQCVELDSTCAKLNEAMNLKPSKILLVSQLFNTGKHFYSLNYDKVLSTVNTDGNGGDGTNNGNSDSDTDEPVETANKFTIAIIILIAIVSLVGLIAFAFFVDKFKKCYLLNSQLQEQRRQQHQQQRQALNYNNLNGSTNGSHKKPYLNGNGALLQNHSTDHEDGESLDIDETAQQAQADASLLNKNRIFFLKNNRIKFKTKNSTS